MQIEYSLTRLYSFHVSAWDPFYQKRGEHFQLLLIPKVFLLHTGFKAHLHWQSLLEKMSAILQCNIAT